MTDLARIESREAFSVQWSSVDSKKSYSFKLLGSPDLFSAVVPGVWLVTLERDSSIIGVGRVFRVRSDTAGLTIFFDKYIDGNQAIASDTLFTVPSKSQIARVDWDLFAEEVSRIFGKAVAEIPVIDNDPAYIRELLQIAVVDDLLGPANGPTEEIVDMSVRDRYLVGRLAPVDAADSNGDLGVEGSTDDNNDPDLIVKAHDSNESLKISNKVDDPESSEEVDTTNNQSIIPSSFGLTFCVAGDVEVIRVHPTWGRYERWYDHERYKQKTDPETGEKVQGQKLKIWKRIPCGNAFDLKLSAGLIDPINCDTDNPGVVIQGAIREPNDNGDRLVTLFLVNTQQELDENKDAAWVFQPEILITGVDSDKAVFRRRPLVDGEHMDSERASLNMIYRDHVEFAVGHGVSVHASVSSDKELAESIRTTVIPEYEVPVTEVPGSKDYDRDALKKLLNDSLLDMKKLAEMERGDLVEALELMTDDYSAWIAEQTSRIGKDVVGFDSVANAAMDRCRQINERLKEGVSVLADPANDSALEAFRFANKAMALQRVHSIYASLKRQGKAVSLEEIDVPKNRSWRSFQLAFLLLSIPALSNPGHSDRANPAEAFADLLWFPTGGGKTEAYLGVAAFTMSVRRLQGDLGGYDSSRGLSVIMRYTLRLLTLQQFQRATALISAMEIIRREASEAGDNRLGSSPFTIGLWVGNKVTPGTSKESDQAIRNIRNPDKFDAGSTSPAQLTSCPWCGSDVDPKRDIEVDIETRQTKIFCGDKKGRCEFSKARSISQPHPGIPALVVDEEIYHRPPSMMIATVDKFAMMAWRGQTRTLFGKARAECPRHGLIWPGGDCNGNHQRKKDLPSVTAASIREIRPPDLIIQDEFHLISGPLGTMVGLYETAVDELCSWDFDGQKVRPKVIASTATVRKAREQVNGVFNRKVAIFPPHGLDVADNFFSVQRPIREHYGRRYLGICSPGSARPAVLIRVYTALLTASQALFNRFGKVVDPYMTTVGYFNSLRELGGMRRLAEDDVQTRSYRVSMSEVSRPGLSQRSVSNIRELTSRVSSQDIPKYLDQLEIPFNAQFDESTGQWNTVWNDGDSRAIDVVLATNMLSVGVDVNRLGVMAVNGQPKTTAEYIQATSRVGRSFPGLVCSVLTWSRPRDLSHYETFEHYHATFYQHVEAQSVTPFSPRAMERGLTGSMLALMRITDETLCPNDGAELMNSPSNQTAQSVEEMFKRRALMVEESAEIETYSQRLMRARLDSWVKETGKQGRSLAYEKRGQNSDRIVSLLKTPGITAWDEFTVPMSMREVEPTVKLQMSTSRLKSGPDWKPKTNVDKGGEQ